MAISAARLLIDVTVDAKTAAKELDRIGQKLAKDFPGTATASRIAVLQLASSMAGPAVAAASALGSALVAVSAAAAPALGVGAAIAPIYSAAGQALGVAALAMQGVTDAASKYAAAGGDVKKMAAALKGLTPEAAQMAKTLAATKGPVDALRQAAQRGLFPGLNKALDTLLPKLPNLRDEVRATGREMGSVAALGANLLTRRLGDVQAIAQGNLPIIGALGRTGLILANSLVTITKAAQPMALWLAEDARAAALFIDRAITAGAKSGDMAAFFKRAYDTAAQLGRILRDVAIAVFNVFSAGVPSGERYLSILERGAAALRKWTESGAGVAALVGWFETGEKNMAALARLFKAVTAASSGLFAKTDIGAFTDQLSMVLVPALGRMFAALSNPEALSTLVDGLAGLADLIGRTGGTLDTFASVFTGIVKGFTWIADNVPGATTALGAFLTIAAANRAASILGLGGAIQTLTGKITALTGAAIRSAAVDFAAGFKSAAAAADASTGIFGTLGGAVRGSVGSFKAWIAAQRAAALAFTSGSGLLNGLNTLRLAILNPVSALKTLGAAVKAFTISLLTNPIFLVVAAIVALGLAFYAAYKYIPAFHAAVDSVAVVLRGALGTAVQWVTGTALPALVTAFHAVVGAVTTIVAAISPVVATLVNIFMTPIQGVIGVLRGFIQIITGIFTGDLSKVTAGVASIVVGLIQVFAGIPVKVIALLVKFGPTLAALGMAAISTMASAIASGASAVWAFFTSLPGKAAGLAKALGQKLIVVGVSAMRSMASGIASGAAAMWSFFRSLPGKAASAAAALPGLLAALGMRALRALHDAEVNGAKAVISFMASLPGKIKGALGDVGSLLVQAGRDIVLGLAHGIADAAGAALGAAKATAGKIVSGLKGAFKMHSPSRVTYDIGKDGVGQGLVNGLVAAGSFAARAAAVLAGKATPKPPALPVWAKAYGAAIVGSMAAGVMARQDTLESALSATTGRYRAAVASMPDVFRKTASLAVSNFSNVLLGGSDPTGPAATAAQKFVETMFGDFAAATEKRAGLVKKIADQNDKIVKSQVKLDKNTRDLAAAQKALGSAKTPAARTTARNRITTLKEQRTALQDAIGDSKALNTTLAAQVRAINGNAIMSAKVRDSVTTALIQGASVLDAIASQREDLAAKIKDATDDYNTALKARVDFASAARDTVAAFASITSVKGGDVDTDKVAKLTTAVELAQSALDRANEDATSTTDALTQAREAAAAALDRYGAGSKEATKAAGAVTQATRAQSVAADAAKRAAQGLTDQQKSLDKANQGEVLSAGLIVKQLRARLDATRAFVANIDALRSAGLNDTALQDLVRQGPEAAGEYAAALAAGGRDMVSQVNDLQGQVQGLAQSFGDKTAGWFYDSGVQAAKGILDGLQSQDTALSDAMQRIADSIVQTVNKALGIHSPARKLIPTGKFSVLGVVKGITSNLGALRAAAGQMATAATPDPVMAASAPRSAYQPGVAMPGRPGLDSGTGTSGGPVIGEVHFHDAHLSPAAQVSALSWQLGTVTAGRV